MQVLFLVPYLRCLVVALCINVCRSKTTMPKLLPTKLLQWFMQLGLILAILASQACLIIYVPVLNKAFHTTVAQVMDHATVVQFTASKVFSKLSKAKKPKPKPKRPVVSGNLQVCDSIANATNGRWRDKRWVPYSCALLNPRQAWQQASNLKIILAGDSTVNLLLNSPTSLSRSLCTLNRLGLGLSIYVSTNSKTSLSHPTT